MLDVDPSCMSHPIIPESPQVHSLALTAWVIATEGVPYLTSARNCNYLARCVNADRLELSTYEVWQFRTIFANHSEYGNPAQALGFTDAEQFANYRLTVQVPCSHKDYRSTQSAFSCRLARFTWFSSSTRSVSDAVSADATSLPITEPPR